MLLSSAKMHNYKRFSVLCVFADLKATFVDDKNSEIYHGIEEGLVRVLVVSSQASGIDI